MTGNQAETTRRRKALVSETMQAIKEVVVSKGLSRGTLDEVKRLVAGMTNEPELFSDADFPTPTPDEFAKIYLLSDEEGGDYSLYLISVLPLGPSPVHDHGTFAVIAGIDGEEENTVYKRLDDKSVPGKATLEEDFRVVLKQGDGIAFMPEDIHHINVVSDKPTRHFHLYGKGFDQQTDRQEFNLKEGTAKNVSGSFARVDDSRRVV